MSSAYDVLAEHFGSQPNIRCSSPTEYRVSYPDWHLHCGATSGSPFGDGKTLEQACAALVVQIENPAAELIQGPCNYRCDARYVASPKFMLAYEQLRARLVTVNAEAERLPWWKRGLPPCPAEKCERAAGHKCRHGRIMTEYEEWD